MEKGEDLRDSQETYEKQNGTLQATHMTIYWHVSMNEQQDHLWMMLWICVLLDHRPLSADTDPILYIVLILSNISLLVITFVIIKKKTKHNLNTIQRWTNAISLMVMLIQYFI